MNVEETIKKLRSPDRFVFVYNFSPSDKDLPIENLKSKLRVRLDKTMEAYFQDSPSVAKYHNEPQRY
jgi:hypothetical protein